MLKTNQPPQPLQCSAPQKSPSGYITPGYYDDSKIRRATTKRRGKRSVQERNFHRNSTRIQRKSQAGLQEPYVTPSSPDFSKPRAGQRRKHKGAVRQKRHRDADSINHGSTAVSQLTEPVSSRLRSRWLERKH